jgi:hypothetical protein
MNDGYQTSDISLQSGMMYVFDDALTKIEFIPEVRDNT